MIYEVSDTYTGEIIAVFRCQQGDQAAGTLLRFELGNAGMGSGAEMFRLRRGDPERWPQVTTPAFHWYPKEQVSHG